MPHPLNQEVQSLWQGWLGSQAELHAPHLWIAETLSVLRRMAFIGYPTTEQIRQAADLILQLPVRLADDRALEDALTWAERLGQKRMHDALYVALAARLEGEFWTTDQRLFHRARQLGLDWIHHPAET